MMFASSIVFLTPSLLWLLPLTALVLVLPRAPLGALARTWRWLTLVLVLLACAQPMKLVPDAPPTHVLVIDGEVRGEAGAIVERWAPGARRVLVQLGAAPDARDPIAWNDVIHLARAADLGAALDHAQRAIPAGADGAVTVVARGAASGRSWGRGVSALQARGIPVHVRTRPAVTTEPALVGAALDATCRVGQTARVRLDVRTSAAASIELTLDGTVVDTVRAEPDGDGRATAWAEFEPRRAGTAELRASIVGHPAPEAFLTRRIAIAPAPRVLYLGGRQRGGGAVWQRLVGSTVTIVGAPGDEPLDAFDAIVIDDRTIEELPEAQQAAIVRAVRNHGTGLFVAGGEAAFGAGGWHDSTLAGILPVDFVQKEEKRDPSTTLVVIIDTSGSMSGERVQLAKEVSRLAIRRLLPHDKVGIVEFYGAKRWAAPIQPASNLIELERALNRLDAGGGTVILPAIEEAFYGLQNVQTRYKHVLVLTDGGVEQGAFEPLLRRMSEKGINVSTVLVGSGAHSEFLVTLANWGKGRYYGVPNRFNLPEIMLKQPASAKLPPYLPGAHPLETRRSARWWGPIDRDAVPPLAAYVETRARPGAEVVIETTDAGHPVLASWRWGLGRVTAFMSEPVGGGTEAWTSWSSYGAWLGRMLERTAADDRRAFDWTIDRDGVWVTLRAQRRFDAPADAVPSASVNAAALAFDERGAGAFVAQFTVAASRDAVVTTPDRMLVAPAIDAFRAPVQLGPERLVDGAALAAATGGTVLTSMSGPTLAVAGATQAVAGRPWWPWLALLALVLYLGDVTWRRRSGRRILA